MAKSQPSVEVLLQRFASEIDSAFYPYLILSIIQQHPNVTIADIRQHIARMSDGISIRSVAADKQLIGRMDKTFGLIDCVGGDSEGRRFRINKKGGELLEQSRKKVISPLLENIVID